MKKCFCIVRVSTTTDMGVGNRENEWTCIEEERLTPGAVFDVYNGKLCVVAIDEDEMEFTFMGVSHKINRMWQVLGTPEIGLPCREVPGHERYIFLFSNDSDSPWSLDTLSALAADMDANTEEGNLWKNIPLVREFVHELKDVAPFRNDFVNPAYKAYYIYCLLERDIVEMRTTPRLFQSLCELYRLYIDFAVSADYDEDLLNDFDKRYFRTVDNWIYLLAWIVENPTGDHAIDCWESSERGLKSDPIQATAEWEKAIYDVEKEVDEELKDEPRCMGFCFTYWSAKRSALARRGIEWRSPSEMNPKVIFD